MRKAAEQATPEGAESLDEFAPPPPPPPPAPVAFGLEMGEQKGMFNLPWKKPFVLGDVNFKMPAMQWTPLRGPTVKGTLFEKVNEQHELDDLMNTITFDSFAAAFRQPIESRTAVAPVDSGTRVAKTFIDSKRSQAVGSSILTPSFLTLSPPFLLNTSFLSVTHPGNLQ